VAYFIVSLDGGGIRGVLTARLLQRVEQAKPFLQRVDLFTGTSTGGILALGLAHGLSPAQLVQLYVEQGDDIFESRDLLDKVSGPADELWRADYSNKGLTSALEHSFQDKARALTLGHLKKKVLIPTFDLDNGAKPPEVRAWKPKFLHNYETPGNDRAVGVIDAALRTSAAPTYFPTHQGFIDGGVVANNPSTCALAKVIKAGVPLSEVRMLSLGTGFSPHVIRGDHDWGKAQWVSPLLDILMDGMSGVANYQCEQLLGTQYLRLDAVYSQVIALDDVERIDTLLRHADQVDLGPVLAWLGQ
jgi:uncharacterized protein